MQQEKEKCENGKISMDEFIQWLKSLEGNGTAKPVTTNLPRCLLIFFQNHRFLGFL